MPFARAGSSRPTCRRSEERLALPDRKTFALAATESDLISCLGHCRCSRRQRSKSSAATPAPRNCAITRFPIATGDGIARERDRCRSTIDIARSMSSMAIQTSGTGSAHTKITTTLLAALELAVTKSSPLKMARTGRFASLTLVVGSPTLVGFRIVLLGCHGGGLTSGRFRRFDRSPAAAMPAAFKARNRTRAGRFSLSHEGSLLRHVATPLD